ncbi:MAG: 23S rRNA (guanosine(2251)-2'-O)-methyltransferase RlmB [Chlamydiota bacterium]
MSNRKIMGKNCLKELLKSAPQRILKVYTSKDSDDLLTILQENQIPVKKLSKKELTNMVDSESHQGYVAQVSEKPAPKLENLYHKEKSLVVMLDSIFDPQNLGAILRACECFGVDAVVWSKNRGSSITPTVSKASVGASELIETIQVSNLVETIKSFKKHGYWAVTTEIANDAHSLADFDFPEKTVLILGSEGTGVRPLVSKQADFRVYIPMAGMIDSLNVSQATAVLLAQWHSNP